MQSSDWCVSGDAGVSPRCYSPWMDMKRADLTEAADVITDRSGATGIPDKLSPSCVFPSSQSLDRGAMRSWAWWVCRMGESEHPTRPQSPPLPTSRAGHPTRTYSFLCLQRTVSAFNNSNEAAARFQKMLFGASSLP